MTVSKFIYVIGLKDSYRLFTQGYTSISFSFTREAAAAEAIRRHPDSFGHEQGEESRSSISI